jgi:hypothetical protein
MLATPMAVSEVACSCPTMLAIPMAVSEGCLFMSHSDWFRQISQKTTVDLIWSGIDLKVCRLYGQGLPIWPRFAIFIISIAFFIAKVCILYGEGFFNLWSSLLSSWPRFAFFMARVCFLYGQGLLSSWPRFAFFMAKVCLLYGRGWLSLWRRFAFFMTKVCLLYAF